MRILHPDDRHPGRALAGDSRAARHQAPPEEGEPDARPGRLPVEERPALEAPEVV